MAASKRAQCTSSWIPEVTDAPVMTVTVTGMLFTVEMIGIVPLPAGNV